MGSGRTRHRRSGSSSRDGARISCSYPVLLSPDLNPIEEAFSKIKQLVRKVGARTREALLEAIERALAAVRLEDAAGWFAHAGYEPQDQSL